MKSYKDIRHLIKHGDTFATASPALFSRLIRLFTRSKVSHVGVFVGVGDRLYIVEAMEGSGVRAMPASTRFEEERLSVYRGGNLDEELVQKDIGRKYDLKGALLANYKDTKSDIKFCSEAVAQWLQLDFSHLNRGILPSDICTKLNRVV